MFWDTKDPPSHNIEILLESPDTKVEVFLEEDNIIQECKTQKKNIVNYFTRPDVIRRMIELITTEPPEDVPICERFRHGNVACEILTMGLPSLDEKLLADVDTLNMLYSYLENEPPLNPLLASFFSKTFSTLFTKRSDQDWFLYQQMCLKLLEYLKSKNNFLDLICKHFTTPIVPDLIMEMMQKVEGCQLQRSLYEWLNEERLVEKLIEIIGDPEQSEKHANVADFLCDLIHQGRIMRQGIDSFEPAFEGSDPILQKFESATTLLALFNVILQPNAIESAIVSGITVVLKIIKFVKLTDGRTTERLLYIVAREMEIHDEFLTTVIRVIEPQLKHLNELLKNPPKSSTDSLTSPRFGMVRLQICRLFAELLQTQNEEIFKGICETDFLDVLLALFAEYCWNNFLHSEVEKCLHAIFRHPSLPAKAKTNNNLTLDNDGTKDNENTNTNSKKDKIEEMLDSVINNINFDFFDGSFGNDATKTPDSNPPALQTHAIVNCKIVSKLIDCWKANKEMESGDRGRRLGYMGHLINIFKHITNCMSESELIGALIESNLKDDGERELWQSIVNPTDGELMKALNMQSKLLANHEPCEHNVSLDFFTDNTISDAFYGLCTLMDSSDAFGRSNDEEEGDEEDDNATASFNPDGGGLSAFGGLDLSDFADFPLYNSLQPANNQIATTPTSGDIAFNTGATTTSEEYDNNANVEKSASWSGDFTSFQMPIKDTQFTANFEDDYEDDEGMWTKPLGLDSASTTTVEHSETHSNQLAKETDNEFKTNFITNGPSVLGEGENVPETSLNQLNNSIDDNTLIGQTDEDITANDNNEETNKEMNSELNLKQDAESESKHDKEDQETNSKHKLNNLDAKNTETANTNSTTHTTPNELTNTATAVDELSDGSITATTTAATT